MRRVVLVEDEERLRRILVRNLEQRGYTVAEADTAAAAVGRCTESPARVLILDVNLPDASGWDVLRELQARCLPRPAVVMVSAVSPSAARLSEFGPLTFLQKPFPIEALLRAVERAEAKESDDEPLDRASV